MARELGAIEVVVGVMNTHIADLNVCHNSCAALLSMIKDNSK